MTKNRKRKQDARRAATEAGVSYIQALRESQLNEILHGIPTPISELNRLVGGWQPGQLITVGSRPGVGKTTFAVNSTAVALGAGKSVLYFSLELGAKELLQWEGSLLGGIPKGNPRRSQLEIDGSPQQFLSSIRDRALKRSMAPGGLDLILIDYLQLIGLPRANGVRVDQVAALTLGLKRLALELNVPLIVLAQTNRNADSDAAPSLTDLRDSSSLAMDSDLVILLGRNSVDSQILELIVAKNRGGSTGTVRAPLREVRFALKNILGRPNPILEEYGQGMLSKWFTLQEFLEGWNLDGAGTTKAEKKEARADIRRFEELFRYGIRSGDTTVDQGVVRSIAESWAEGNPMVSTEHLTIWELGENGDTWFVEGTIDQALANMTAQRWIAETSPDTLQDYYDHGQFRCSAHRDWYWEPLFPEIPDAEAKLSRVEKSGNEENRPLMAGVLVQFF